MVSIVVFPILQRGENLVKIFLEIIVFAFAVIVLLPFLGFWIVALIAGFGVLIALYAEIAPFWGGEEWLRRKIANFSSLVN